MDLREWITSEHASVLDRFDKSIVDVVPADRWRDPVGDGGSSIAYLLYHVTYHEDLAINAVVRGGEPLMAAWRGRLGVSAVAVHAGLGETEDTLLSESVDLDALVAYARAASAATASWLEDANLAALTDVPPSGSALETAGIAQSAVPWLHAMWSGKPASFFVQWEAIGHRLNHLGEMVSVRNRLGLSPF
jgi:hypothetical protein